MRDRLGRQCSKYFVKIIIKINYKSECWNVTLSPGRDPFMSTSRRDPWASVMRRCRTDSFSMGLMEHVLYTRRPPTLRSSTPRRAIRNCDRQRHQHGYYIYKIYITFMLRIGKRLTCSVICVRYSPHMNNIIKKNYSLALRVPNNRKTL